MTAIDKRDMHKSIRDLTAQKTDSAPGCMKSKEGILKIEE